MILLFFLLLPDDHIGSKTNQTNLYESFVLSISWEAFGIVSLPFGRPILGE